MILRGKITQKIQKFKAFLNNKNKSFASRFPTHHQDIWQGRTRQAAEIPFDCRSGNAAASPLVPWQLKWIKRASTRVNFRAPSQWLYFQLKFLSKRNLHKIVDLLEEEVFAAGDTIIHQGAHGNTFYVISEGTVRISITDDKGKKSSSKIIFIFRYIAEMRKI